jgi:hypothetical protein
MTSASAASTALESAKMIPTLALVAVICGALDPDEDPPPPHAASNSAANATINRDLKLDIVSSLYCPRGIFQPR